MRIVLCYPVQPRHLEQIQATVPDAEVIDAGQARVAEELPQADVLCGHVKVPVPWDEVVAAGRLRWIQSSAAGLDHCLVPQVIDSPILVTSASGVLADQVAEHTMMLLGALHRNMTTFFRAQQQREFIRRPTRDLHHSTVGIVGFGGVGRRLAELLAPYRVRILATDYFPVERPRWVEQLLPPERLEDILPQLDTLVLCAPLTEQTRGMVNARLLERLRPGAFLVNVARGPLVVEEDLVAALESGHLAGAALDVTPEEPPRPESPLWQAPNLILTPHVAGQSAWRIDRMTDLFCENLRRFLDGRPLINLVDKHLGFPRPEHRTYEAWRREQESG